MRWLPRTLAAAAPALITMTAAPGCLLDVERKVLVLPDRDAGPDQTPDQVDQIVVPDSSDEAVDRVDTVPEAADLLPPDGCIPATCASLGVECGDWDNGCGGITVCVCPAGDFDCRDGLCVCPSSHAQCGEGCFDLDSSSIHCGECNHACPSGWSCSGGTCVPECPAGWRVSVVSEASGYAFCYSDYRGTADCCDAWAACGLLGARPGWGWGPDPPPELTGMVPLIVQGARADMVEGDCNQACYYEGSDGEPVYSGSGSYYACTAGTLCATDCHDAPCGGATFSEGCACQLPYWCHIQIGPS